MAGFGDELMAAGQAHRLHQETGKPIVICEVNGRPRWHPLWAGLDFIVNPKVQDVEGAEFLINGGGARPYCKRTTLEDGGYIWTDWRACEHTPVIALSPEEKLIGHRAKMEFGPFVLVDASPSGFCNVNRYWGFENFQRVIDLTPEINWVQSRKSSWTELKGAKQCTTESFRDALGLASAASLILCGDAGLSHAAPAIQVHAVVFYGGNLSMHHLAYPQNVNFGSDRPCGKFGECSHCAEHRASVTPEIIAAAVREKLNG